MYHFTDLEIDTFSDSHLEEYKYELNNINELTELNYGIAAMVIRFCNPVSRLFPLFEGISKYCVRENDYAQTLRDLLRRGLKEHLIRFDTTENFFKFKDNVAHLSTLRSKGCEVRVTVTPRDIYDHYNGLFGCVMTMLNDTKINKWKANYFDAITSYGIDCINAVITYSMDVGYALDINTDATGSFYGFDELFDRSFPKWRSYKINKISEIYNFFTLVITALNSLYHYQAMQLAEYENFSVTVDNESEYHRIMDLMKKDHDEYVDMINDIHITKEDFAKKLSDMAFGEKKKEEDNDIPEDFEHFERLMEEDEVEEKKEEKPPVTKPTTERKNGVLYFDFSKKNDKKDDEDKKENS